VIHIVITYPVYYTDFNN